MCIENIFLKYFKNAINSVPDHYYGRDFWNDSTMNYFNSKYGLDSKPEIREKLHKYLDNYGERVFCYELYYQLKSIINLDTDLDIALEAEIQKPIIEDSIADLLSIKCLSKKYFPDFIFHTHENAENQIAVVEVKKTKKLKFSQIYYDLNKLDEFISNYKFRIGILLIVSYPADKLKKMLKRNYNKINLTSLKNINILSKENYNSKLENIEFQIESDIGI